MLLINIVKHTSNISLNYNDLNDVPEEAQKYDYSTRYGKYVIQFEPLRVFEYKILNKEKFRMKRVLFLIFSSLLILGACGQVGDNSIKMIIRSQTLRREIRTQMLNQKINLVKTKPYVYRSTI